MHGVHQAQVAGAAEHVIGDARNDQLSMLDARMTERVGVRDVAVDTLDVLATKFTHDGRVEVDDEDLFDERSRFFR